MASTPSTHTSRKSSHPTRPSLLHAALFMLSCLLLAAQGAQTSKSPQKPPTSLLTRRERDAGCAQSCAQVSEMKRCLRIACRKVAMGPLIRFGKRGRVGSGGSATEVAQVDGAREVADAGSSLGGHREDILETLLSRGQSQRRGSWPHDWKQEPQLELEPDGADVVASINRLVSPRFDLARLVSPQTSRRLSPLLERDLQDDRLLLWLLQASKDFHRQSLLRQQQQTSPVEDAGRFDLDPTAKELGMRTANYWDWEAEPSSQTARSLSNDLVSPLSYHDLSGMLGKRTSGAAEKDRRAYSILLPSPKMRRHQRGLPKHLIRFG